MIERIRTTMPPLRGVVHAAMVLDDAPLGQLDAERLDRVMSPKVAGAWNLHHATKDDPLEFFVMFSSVTSLMGTPLQANYAAANAFLDALCYYRRSRGLAAQTINWGVLSGVGWVAQHTEIGDYLARQGYLSFSPDQALQTFEELLRLDPVHVMAARIDWKAWAKSAPAAAAAPRMRYFSTTDDEAEAKARSRGDEPLTALLNAPAAEREARLEDYLRARVGKVLGIAPARIDPERPLNEMGLDSLIAVELMTVLKMELSVGLPVVKLLQGITIGQLRTMVDAQLAPAAVPSAGSENAPHLASTNREERVEAADEAARCCDRSSRVPSPLESIPRRSRDTVRGNGVHSTFNRPPADCPPVDRHRFPGGDEARRRRTRIPSGLRRVHRGRESSESHGRAAAFFRAAAADGALCLGTPAQLRVHAMDPYRYRRRDLGPARGGRSGGAATGTRRSGGRWRSRHRPGRHSEPDRRPGARPYRPRESRGPERRAGHPDRGLGPREDACAAGRAFNDHRFTCGSGHRLSSRAMPHPAAARLAEMTGTIMTALATMLPVGVSRGLRRSRRQRQRCRARRCASRLTACASRCSLKSRLNRRHLRRSGGRLLEAVDQAVLADQLGYHCIWAVEHHGLIEYSHCSAPEVLLSFIAARTQRIRLGHAVTLTAHRYNHPIRVAERVAMLDVLSGGRVSWGPARARRGLSRARSRSIRWSSTASGARRSR